MFDLNRIPGTATHLLLFLFACSGCYAPMTLTTTVPTLATREFKTPPEKIVVANAYDVKAASVRNNKEKLFSELIDFTVRHTANEIGRRSLIPASFVEGISVPSARSDSSIRALMTDQQASHAIIVTSFNAAFEQTHVEVTVNEGSKSKRAYYDILVDIDYSFHNWAGWQFDTLISVRKFHSSRNVLSGLLAAGPNIVSNSEDAADGIYANVDMYLKSFFRGTEPRKRNVFMSKEFTEVKNAIRAADHQRAFELSEALMNSEKNTVAAMASYNCAVLLEFLGQYDKVKYYLEESERKQRVQMPEVQMMLTDYRLYRAHR